jgi:hypothetical protein
MVCEASAVLLLLAALLLVLVLLVEFWPAAQEGHWPLGLAGSQL